MELTPHTIFFIFAVGVLVILMIWVTYSILTQKQDPIHQAKILDEERKRQKKLTVEENPFQIKALKEQGFWLLSEEETVEDITHKDVSGGSKSGMN